MNSQFHSTLHDNGVAEIVLDRAPVNALNTAGWHGLAAEISRMGERAEVRVIVIRAENRGFCAGVDIKELAANDKLIVSVNAGNYATFKAVHLNKVPVIVAVHGFVLGGGIGICGAADIVIAADDASFGLPEVDRGAMGGAAHLQRMFGVQKTRYLFFTGEMIGAQEAFRLGAIERVVPREALRDTAMTIAARIAAKSPAMIRIAKEALTGIEASNLEDQYRWEQGFTLQAYMSPDSAATRAAFVDKREAKF
jgi:enoyl-CoA hydratase